MPKNPFLNAGLAALYIIAITTMLNLASRYAGPDNNLVAPVAFLSLFTLSAAVMGYLFLGEPIQMYLAGDKKMAVTFFLKTLLTFAAFTIVVLLVTFSGVLPA